MVVTIIGDQPCIYLIGLQTLDTLATDNLCLIIAKFVGRFRHLKLPMLRADAGASSPKRVGEGPGLAARRPP